MTPDAPSVLSTTQPFILSGSINEYRSKLQLDVLANVSLISFFLYSTFYNIIKRVVSSLPLVPHLEWRRLMNAYGVKAGIWFVWVAGITV